MFSRSLMALLAAAFFLAGCSAGTGVAPGGVSGTSAPDSTATLLVGLPTTPMALEGIDQVRYAGFDRTGGVVFQGVERPVSGTHVLGDVPTDTTLVQVEFLDDGDVEALGHHDVDLAAGGTVAIPQAEFAPPPTALASLAVSPRTERVAAGTSTQLQATATLDDGKVLDYTTFVFWTSSDAGVASVALNTGLASGVAPGAATVTIRQAGLSSTGTVEVTNATLARLDVLPSLPGVILGVPQPLQALGSFSDGSQQDLTAQVGWTTSDGAVVTVTPQGVATGVAVDCADVTAAFGAVQGFVTLDVHDSAGLTVEVESEEAFLADGTVTQARAFAVVPDGTRQDVTLASQWTGTTGILGVGTALGRQGLVTALDPGAGTLTATLGGVSGSASLEVTSATVSSLALDPPAALSAPGTRRAWRVRGGTSDGRTQDLTRMVSFTSSDSGVVDISNFSTERGVGAVAGPIDQTATIGAALPGTALTSTGPLHTGLYVYLVAEIFGQVIGLQPDVATGELTFLEALTGTESPDDLAIHPSGLFVYVLNYDTDAVSGFSVNPDTGLLTELGDFPVPDCTCSSKLGMDPRGRFLYVPTGTTEDISLFAIDPQTGLLTDLGIAETCGPFPVDAAIHPNGRFLYVSDVSTETIWTYAIDRETGALGSPTQIPLPHIPQVFAMDPLGRFAWMTYADSRDIDAFAVNPWTGAWTAGVPPSTTAAEHPASVVADPKARFVYSGTIDDGTTRSEEVTLRGEGCGSAASQRIAADLAECGCGEDTVEGFTIGGGGGLAATVPPVVATAAYPTSIAIDPTGRFAWAAGYLSEAISAFTVDQSTGALTPLATRDLTVESFGLFHLMATP